MKSLPTPVLIACLSFSLVILTPCKRAPAESSPTSSLPSPLVHEDAPLEKEQAEPEATATPQPSPEPSASSESSESSAAPDGQPKADVSSAENSPADNSPAAELREVRREPKTPAAVEVDLVSNAKAIQVLDEILGPRPAEPQSQEIGRPERVDEMVNKLQGDEASPPQAKNNTKRGVIYHSKKQLPAVLAAAAELNQVDLDQVKQEDGPNQFRLTYEVDPASRLSRQDILFRSGSTAFSDSDSFYIVQDLANALRDPALEDDRFMIEGHASAEGDAMTNLRLSQERAQRIARELVAMGIAPRRVLPIGYGESEARHDPGDSEKKRRLDRRVVIYRLTQ